MHFVESVYNHAFTGCVFAICLHMCEQPGTDPEHLMWGDCGIIFFFFFDIDRGINLKYIKVTYKNKLRAIKKKGKWYFINLST
jgi:hypothetical protein